MRQSKGARKPSPAEVLEAAKGLLRGWARKGGKSRAQKLTPEERREIARKAAKARWDEQKKRKSSR